MDCLYCKKPGVKAFVHIMMYVDADDASKITKQVISKKSSELWALDHAKTSFVCPHCSRVWGYPYDQTKEDKDGTSKNDLL